MKPSRNWFWTALVTVVVGVGCGTVVRYVGDQGTGGTGSTGGSGGGGFATLDSNFTNDPVSPGGTGGTAPPDPNTGDVELPAQDTRSFFTAFQVDPVAEDTAGPKFVIAGDIDQDGLMDLVSAWNQSQPIQIHLQRRDPAGVISFRTITLAGTMPIAIVAGVAIGHINGDAYPDIVVLSKATGVGGYCPTNPPQQVSQLEGEIVVYFNPANDGLIADGDSWAEMILINPFVRDRWIHNQFPGIEDGDLGVMKTQPEHGGFTSLAVGNLDGNDGDEIVVALNPAECKELGQKPPLNTVDVWVNPGGDASTNPSNWGVPADIPLSSGVPIAVMWDAPMVSSIALDDVDSDGDLDVVAAYTTSISLNVRWARNPLISPSGGGFADVAEGASEGLPDLCSGGANDGGLCPNGNSDCPGIPDGICVASVCVGGALPGGACTTDSDCGGLESGTCVAGSWHFFSSNWENRPIGQVDTGANMLSIADVDTDGFNDVAVRSTTGQLVQWFRRPNDLTMPPEFPPGGPTPDRTDFPWSVFTLTEFDQQEPEAIAFGDVTGDGQPELLVAVEGGVYWFDGTLGTSVYDPWVGTTIIQDSTPETTAPTASTGATPPTDQPAQGTVQGGTGVGVTATDVSTNINALLAVDLDGDGRIDVIGTLDRRSGSGLSDDRLVWYRNTKTDN